jgi:DegV family protein with EDD domain
MPKLSIIAEESAMKSVAIVTDTNSLITKDLAKEYDIELAPLYISIGDKSYPEDEINLTDFYQNLLKWKQDNKLPKTAAPSVADFIGVFKELSQKARSIIYVGYSSKLGMAIDSALQAKTKLQNELPDTNIEVVDTCTGCGAQMLITLEAARAATSAKNLDEVLQVCQGMVRKVNFIFLSDNLYYLMKGGRIHKARPWASSKVSNTVLLEMDVSTGGQNTPVARCRTKGQALRTLFDLVRQRSGDKKIHVAIDHADAEVEARELKDRVTSQFKCVEVYINQMRPVLTTHTGVGSRIFSWWSED